MKKVFILMLSFGAATAVFAQDHDRGYGDYRQSNAPVVHDGRGGRDVNDDHRGDNGFYGRHDNNDQMARINRAYDDRIAAVQYDRWMWPGAKAREIRRLERERNERLRQFDMGYSKSYDRHDDHDGHDDRRGW